MNVIVYYFVLLSPVGNEIILKRIYFSAWLTNNELSFHDTAQSYTSNIDLNKLLLLQLVDLWKFNGNAFIILVYIHIVLEYTKYLSLNLYGI
jgi:hypothetical protein